MIRNKTYIFLFFWLLFFHNIKSQNPVIIKVKKLPGEIYFFQKGISSDTISKNKNNLFYLLVPDSLKKNISVLVENGQLILTENDSIIKLVYMKSLKYESLYTKADLLKENPSPNSSRRKKVDPGLNNQEQSAKLEFRTLINGTSAYSENKILIQIYNRKTGKIVLENIFYYKN